MKTKVCLKYFLNDYSISITYTAFVSSPFVSEINFLVKNNISKICPEDVFKTLSA